MPRVLIEDVVEYVRSHPRLPASQWPKERLREYVSYYAAKGCLHLALADGRICGLAIGVQCRRSQLEQPYVEPDAAGECYMVLQLAGDSREALAEVWRVAAARVPALRQLKIYGFRRGTLHRAKAGAVKRLGQHWMN